MTLKEKCAALENRIKRLQEIGLSLSTEDDINVIFELIMEEAKNITNADGRTLYMISEDAKTMKFEILRNDSIEAFRKFIYVIPRSGCLDAQFVRCGIDPFSSDNEIFFHE